MHYIYLKILSILLYNISEFDVQQIGQFVYCVLSRDYLTFDVIEMVMWLMNKWRDPGQIAAQIKYGVLV